MECPKFANYITVTNLNNSKEFVLNFFHDFPVIGGCDGEGKVQVSFDRSHVCGVILNKDIAAQMYDILTKHLAKGEGDE